MISKEQYLELSNHPSMQYLDIEQFDKLAKEVRFRKIKKDNVFFFADDWREYLYILVKGYVRIEAYDQTDTYTYLDYIREGTSFPYGGIFEKPTYGYNAVAVTDIECLLVPMKLYEEISQQNSKQMVAISKKLVNILSFQELRLRNTYISSASERVVQVLAVLYWDLCRQKQLTQFPFTITVQEIARMSATTRETASRVLKNLVDEGKIDYQHKQLTYLDIPYFTASMEEAF